MKKSKPPTATVDVTQIGRIICAGIGSGGAVCRRYGDAFLVTDDDSVYTFRASECRDLARAFQGAALILESKE